MYKKYIFYFLFCLIILFGFLVRVWNVDKNPAGFFCDEASVGYNAYTILKTGHDEWGIKFPLFFRAFGEYKNPLDIYFTVIPISIFGLNEFSVRFTSIIFSMLTGLIIYFIGKILINKYFGLLLSTIYFFVPWSIHLARINLEGFDIFFLLILASLYELIIFQKYNKSIHLFIFALLLGLSTYSYFPARIIIPILGILVYLYLFIKKHSKKNILISGFIYSLIILPLIFHVFFGNGASRWQQVSLFNQKNINVVKKITTSYWLHFSPDFIFLKGDIDMTGQFITRHSVRGIGELYLWQAPFIIFGIFLAFKNIKKIENYFMLILLLLYPIPTSLTADLTPQATRSLAGLIPLIYFTGLGYWQTSKLLKINLIKIIFNVIMFVIIFISIFNFLKLYNRYPLYSSDYWGWQYGPREIMDYYKTQSKNYDNLYLSGDFNAPDIFLKFYDSEKKCNNCAIGGIDKINFNKSQLFSLTPIELDDLSKKNNYKFVVKKNIYYPNGSIAFEIVNFKKE